MARARAPVPPQRIAKHKKAASQLDDRVKQVERAVEAAAAAPPPRDAALLAEYEKELAKLERAAKDLDKVGSYQIDTVQFAHHLLGLMAVGATNFRCSGAGCIGGIDKINVIGTIGRVIADNRSGLGHDCRNAAIKQFLDPDDPHAVRLAPFDIVIIIGGATDADLHNLLRIEQPFLDGPPERGAMGVFETAEIAVEQIGMGIEMDHRQRPALRSASFQAAQHRQ